MYSTHLSLGLGGFPEQSGARVLKCELANIGKLERESADVSLIVHASTIGPLALKVLVVGITDM